MKEYIGKLMHGVVNIIPELKYEGWQGILGQQIQLVETFDRFDDAVQSLKDAGYSVGRFQGTSPIGFKKGDWDIQKWRNLYPEHKGQMDGVTVKVGKETHNLYFKFPK
jgi:hypothetical protein